MTTPVSLTETVQTGGNLLNLIEQRFAELEEQVALAGLVPQLHDRLTVVEEQMKQLQDQGFLLLSNDVDAIEPSFSKPIECTDFTGNQRPIGPKWSEAESPRKLVPPDDDNEVEQKEEDGRSLFGFAIDLKSLPAGLTPKYLASLSPTRSRRTQSLSKPPTQELHESLLDLQTQEILNAVALGIILDIDDLLFDALATTPGRHLVHQLDALPMPPMPRIRGADAKSAFMSITIPVLTLTVYFTMLQPMVDTLHDVSFAMCGGNKAFVWNVDPRGVVLLSETPGGGWEEDKGIKNFAVEEAERVGFGIQRSDSKYGVWVEDVSILNDASIMTVAESVDANNPDCTDLTNGVLRAKALNFLRFAHQNESIQGCADVAHECGSLTRMPDFGLDGGKGWATRMFCSESCGCQEPAGQVAVQGCPYGPGRACQMTDRFRNVTKESLCVEKSAASLRSSVDWTNWIKAIRAYGESSADLAGKSDALKIANAMWDHGCDFGANLSAENVSWGNCFGWNSTFEFEFKTVEVFCPLTCQCSSANLASSCPKPFGYACDQLSSNYCLTLNDRHYCAGFTPSLELTLISRIQTKDDNLVDPIWDEIVAAYEDTILGLTGLPNADQFRFFPKRQNRQIYFHFFFYEVDDAVKVGDIDSRFFAPTIAEIGVNLTQNMQLRNLPIDVLVPKVNRRVYGNEGGIIFTP